MVTLHWKDIAPNAEAFHVTSLSLTGRKRFLVHDHDFAELFLVDRGSGTHLLGHAAQPLSTGDLLTVCPGQQHGFRAATAGGFRYLNVAFPERTLSRFRATYLARSELFWREDLPPYCRRLTPVKTQALRALILELSTAPRDQFQIDRFLLNLVHELRLQPAPDCDLSQAPQWLVRACEAAVSPGGPIPTVSEFAHLACRSHEHVSRTMVRCTGQTPTRFLNLARLRRAAHLLSMTDTDIARIALECRFPNAGHFHRLFKTQYGMTPRHYRLTNAAVTGSRETQ
jgi:AraC family cel operon transcriptional repressor